MVTSLDAAPVRRPDDSRPVQPPRRSASSVLPGGTSPERAGHRRSGRRLPALLGALVAIGVALAAVVAPGVLAAGLGAREAVRAFDRLPSRLPSQPLPQRSVVLAADGSQIAQFYNENRIVVPLSDVPQQMQDAVVAIEDSRFYSHHGLDFRGTARAFARNTTSDSTQGGSTLTQQYVKNVLLQSAATDAERQDVSGHSYPRKLKEARLALSVERTTSKKQILEGYLNIAYFGDGAYGIGTAAQHFFGVNPKDLTLAQEALLAGLVQNPAGYDPTQHPEAATARRGLVLGRMRDLHYITPQQAADGQATPITLHITDAANGCTASPFPFYCEWVKQTLADDPAFGATPPERQARLFRGGMTIHTTLDVRAQNIAQQAVDKALGRTNRVASAAVVVEPGTGHVVAMAVNRTFGVGPDQTEVLLPTQPAYQPGSTFKPITLATALSRGFSLSTVIDAPNRYTPAHMNAPPGGFGNAGDSEAGSYNAAQATWRSVNTWYVKLEEQIGVLPVADMAGRLGLTSLPRSGPQAITARDASLTLGAYEVSPLEMAGVYATFAAHGVHCTPVGIASVTEANGTAGPTPDPACHQALTPGVADTVTSVLRGVIDGPDSARTGKPASIGRPAAGKTGTTNNAGAAWFDGYTPQYATAVWVGDPRGGQAHPLQGFTENGSYVSFAFGGPVAGPIWKAIMGPLVAPLPVQDFAPADPILANGYQSVTPDVRGLGLPQALQVLTAAGLTVALDPKLAPASPLTTPDHVSGSVPAPGSPIDSGQTVTLTLTAGSNLQVQLPGKPSAAPVTPAPVTPGQPYDSGNGIVSPRDTPTPLPTPAPR